MNERGYDCVLFVCVFCGYVMCVLKFILVCHRSDFLNIYFSPSLLLPSLEFVVAPLCYLGKSRPKRKIGSNQTDKQQHQNTRKRNKKNAISNGERDFKFHQIASQLLETNRLGDHIKAVHMTLGNALYTLAQRKEITHIEAVKAKHLASSNAMKQLELLIEAQIAKFDEITTAGSAEVRLIRTAAIHQTQELYKKVEVIVGMEKQLISLVDSITIIKGRSVCISFS